MKHTNLKSLCYYIAQCEYSARIFKKENRNIITASEFTSTDFEQIKIIEEKLITALTDGKSKIKTNKEFEKLIKSLAAITRHFTYETKIKKEILNILQIKIKEKNKWQKHKTLTNNH